MNEEYHIDLNDNNYLLEFDNMLNDLQNSILNIENSSNNRYIIQFEFNIEQPNTNFEEDMPNYFKNQKEINNILGMPEYIKKKDEIINKECMICLEKFENKKYKRTLSCCNNTFHKTCIDKWLKKNSTCPACRHDFLKKSN